MWQEAEKKEDSYPQEEETSSKGQAQKEEKITVLVLSDTHIGQQLSWFPDEVLRYLDRVDAIIHAGDFTSEKAYDFLARIRLPLFAVHGNMDAPFVKETLPEKRIVTLGGVKIAITHGWGAPWGIEKRVYSFLEVERPDIMIFGHSHKPLKKRIGKVQLFNPGAVCGEIFSRHRSFGLLTVSSGMANFDLVKF
ncbi:metallophosphoesterase [bacterium]|nr:metallophosphoesterase [bacterium]